MNINLDDYRFKEEEKSFIFKLAIFICKIFGHVPFESGGLRTCMRCYKKLDL